MSSREANEILVPPESISAVRNKQFRHYFISCFIIFILFILLNISSYIFMETVPPQRKHTFVRLNDKGGYVLELHMIREHLYS